MLNKIYLALLAIATLAMIFFTFYAYNWLGSIGSPEIAAENTSYYLSLGWNFLWISFIALVMFACVTIWKNGKSWTLWGAFVYAAIFITLHTFWLAPTLLSFMESNKLTESTFTLRPFIGAMTIIVLAIATFFNQFILFRLRDKIVGNKDADLEKVSAE